METLILFPLSLPPWQILKFMFKCFPLSYNFILLPTYSVIAGYSQRHTGNSLGPVLAQLVYCLECTLLLSNAFCPQVDSLPPMDGQSSGKKLFYLNKIGEEKQEYTFRTDRCLAIISFLKVIFLAS